METSKYRSSKRLAIVEYWAEARPDWLIDISEPMCFACRYYQPGWATWDTPRLENAHIIAKSIGGPDTPSNYLLLCKCCHVEAPMLDNREMMLEWVTRRDTYIQRMCRAFLREFKQLGGTDEDVNALTADPVSMRERVESMTHILKPDSHPMHHGPAPSVTASIFLAAARSYKR